MAPLACAIAVLAVASAPALAIKGTADNSPLSRGSGGGSTPATLNLGATTAVAGRPDGGRFTLAVNLPDGPDHAHAHHLKAASETKMMTLAQALGLTRTDLAEPGVMLFTGAGATLRIELSAGYRWSYSAQGTCSNTPPRDQDVGGVPACEAQKSVATNFVATLAAAPSREQAHRAARPIFSALDLDIDEAVVSAADPATTLTVHPVVDGLPTAGMETAVTVGSEGVTNAHGWFNATTLGAEYPVISAADAFDQLADMPQAMASCPEPLAGTTLRDCGPSNVEIVDARFGLSLQWGGEQPLLVPSWLFSIEGSAYPIARVAVEAEFLNGPHAVPPTYVGPVDPVHPIDPGTNTEPTPVPRPSTSTPPPSQQSTFDSVAVADDERTIKVSFHGADVGCTDYELLAKETSDTVYLTLTHETPVNATGCIKMQVMRYASVTLKAPLGSRGLIDGANNTPMPTKSTEPPATDQPSRFEGASVSDDRRTITVTFYGGVAACNIYELSARETSNVVYLVLSHSTPPTAGACIDIAELREASVTLNFPLGDRRLLDAATGIHLPTTPNEAPPPGAWTQDDGEAPPARDISTGPPGGGVSGPGEPIALVDPQ